MKAMLIKVGIILFIRWLKKNEGTFIGKDDILSRIFNACNASELISAFEDTSTEKDIANIVADIESETISSVVSDIMGK